MKFSTKLILGTTIIISILFSLGGSIMIKENFKVSYEDLVDQNIKQHILYRYSLESSIRNQLENNKKFTKDTIIRSMEKLNSYGQKHSSSSVILNNEFIYSDISKNLIDKEVEKYYSSKNTSYLIKRIDDSIYMYLNSDIQVSNESVKLLNVYDISSIFLERERQNEYYIKWFIVIVSVYIVSVIIFSKILIAPIKKLNETSKRISNGNYTERTNIQTSDEIGELSKSFDSMTESVESHILKLEKDIKNREDFISDFSHELKTPMTSMIGYSRLLMDENCNKELQKKSANYIYSECKRLELLSRKLLKLMEIDEMPIELVSVSTDWMSEKLNIMMQPLIENSNLTWISEWDVCFIKGDGQLLLDLLKNLIENGVNASKDELYISVQGKKIDNNYIISVTDNGCGIEEDEIEKIINPFYIIDKSRSKSNGSTGIGLSICNKIAQLHSSNLEIKSEVKKGTTISIKLEVEDEK